MLYKEGENVLFSLYSSFLTLLRCWVTREHYHFSLLSLLRVVLGSARSGEVLDNETRVFVIIQFTR